MSLLLNFNQNQVAGVTPTVVTLNLSELLLQIPLAWKDPKNLAKIQFIYASPTGKEEKVLVINCVTFQGTFRFLRRDMQGKWSLKNIVLYNFNSGTYYHARKHIPDATSLDVFVKTQDTYLDDDQETISGKTLGVREGAQETELQSIHELKEVLNKNVANSHSLLQRDIAAKVDHKNLELILKEFVKTSDLKRIFLILEELELKLKDTLSPSDVLNHVHRGELANLNKNLELLLKNLENNLRKDISDVLGLIHGADANNLTVLDADPFSPDLDQIWVLKSGDNDYKLCVQGLDSVCEIALAPRI